MSIGININWDAQEIVDMLVEVISLLLEQKMGLLMMIGIIVVIGGLVLLTVGVCLGMCCYAFTKRRSKRLCMCCFRSCWDKCFGDKFVFEFGEDSRDEEIHMVGSGGASKGRHSRPYGSSQSLGDKDGRITPV